MDNLRPPRKLNPHTLSRGGGAPPVTTTSGVKILRPYGSLLTSIGGPLQSQPQRVMARPHQHHPPHPHPIQPPQRRPTGNNPPRPASFATLLRPLSPVTPTFPRTPSIEPSPLSNIKAQGQATQKEEAVHKTTEEGERKKQEEKERQLKEQKARKAAARKARKQAAREEKEEQERKAMEVAHATARAEAEAKVKPGASKSRKWELEPSLQIKSPSFRTPDSDAGRRKVPPTKVKGAQVKGKKRGEREAGGEWANYVALEDWAGRARGKGTGKPMVWKLV
ncbi:unnamed protein product [Rhizoctonia solani]|uniref:Uncharacterized protein n=1 Tax=Rhizoctonia solani TaxID=456999 RepID=A0A8H3CTW8_9AGAM|nr:unnamed protein product [Rhizoctonia solani]